MTYKATIIIGTDMDKSDAERELTFGLDCTDFNYTDIESIEYIE